MKTFVEVGACDVDTCLPLAQNGWHGIVVEANPEIFVSTRELFKDYPNVVCVNVVVSDRDAPIDFVLTAGWGWARGISHVVSPHHKGERLNDYIKNSKNFGETITMEGVSLNTLLKDVNHLDFLKIDAQGHDLNIIEAFNFKPEPTFIKIEHSHCDDAAIAEILKKKGYMIWTEEADLYAIK